MNAMHHHLAATRVNRPTSVFGYVGYLDGFLVAIPPSRIRTTPASVDYMSRKLELPPHVCDGPDHLKCQCTQNLHVSDSAYLEILRGTVGKQVCCAYCDDVFSRHVLEDVPELQCIAPININGHLIPLERLALTTAVPLLSTIGVASAANICKDHLNGHCSRMKDCSNLHVCRKRMGILDSLSNRSATQSNCGSTVCTVPNHSAASGSCQQQNQSTNKMQRFRTSGVEPEKQQASDFY